MKWSTIPTALALLSSGASAYIPAQPVTDTTGMNFSDASTLGLKWYPRFVYQAPVKVARSITDRKTGRGEESRVAKTRRSAVARSSLMVADGIHPYTPRSYQLTADISTGGIDKGALVHFNESTAGDNKTTSTPWIAFISCDFNETNASDYWDIFTLARDRGAIAALLYTTTAESCLLNDEYINNFEKPIDVFATNGKDRAKLIDDQFQNTNQTFWYYNGALLNESGALVNQSLVSEDVPTRTFLIATLTARNSTGQAEPAPTSTSTATAAAKKVPTSQSLAMIILYSITGVVASLFVGVIMIGAIRALRHPERYGVNAQQSEGGGPQTRAQGVGQAILDTFPVIKFNKKPSNSAHRLSGRAPMAYPTWDKDVDTPNENEQSGYNMLEYGRARSASQRAIMEEEELEDVDLDKADMGVARHDEGTTTRHQRHSTIGTFSSDRDSFHSAQDMVTSSRASHAGLPPTGQASSSGGPLGPEIAAAARTLAAHRMSRPLDEREIQEDEAETSAIGLGPDSAAARVDEDSDDVCPICLLEFEQGDDVRLLPCQQAHSYHKECIDPWLLNVSSSCPLCRKDFAAPEEEASDTLPRPAAHSLPEAASPSDPTFTEEPPTSGSTGRQNRSRFGRYLAFVRRERRRAGNDEAGEVEQAGATARLHRGAGSEGRRSRRGTRAEQMGPGPF
ncbi:hypothetical protein QFC22_003896 [Naganishia vaughanmartiniae]|uniref:Uncharacterized protein n=1 Tax=Naganishia vaughanmartiniae TaxID=1424756 RepID=A0ACC2X6I6_9TREE|nr:hypothetical protein QFC22_003896 [Naganishia vaughanmartiniae]